MRKVRFRVHEYAARIKNGRHGVLLFQPRLNYGCFPLCEYLLLCLCRLPRKNNDRFFRDLRVPSEYLLLHLLPAVSR